MMVLDTDHLTILRHRQGARYTRLMNRMGASPETIGTTIVCVEEQMRGWMGSIAKERLAIRQTTAYRELGRLFEFFSSLELLAFDEAAALQFEELRRSCRVSTSDLKIAAIALVNSATVLTANVRHFGKVSGLKFENWLD